MHMNRNRWENEYLYPQHHHNLNLCSYKNLYMKIRREKDLVEDLTVKHAEDFLHHLPEDGGVGVGVHRTPQRYVCCLLTDFTGVAF